MKGKYLILAFIAYIVMHSMGYAQEKMLTVGMQFKPIIPSGLFRSDFVSVVQGQMHYSIASSFGYSGGMVIRKGFLQNFSVESGIEFSRRTYAVKITDMDSMVNGAVFSGNSDFSIINYEIPILALMYVRLGDKWYMNTSVGTSMDFFPSDISTYDSYFSHTALRNHWVQLAGIINHGYELRTEKSGLFYIGGSLHWPFTIIYRSYIQYMNGLLIKDKSTLDLKGNYLTFELRYYFNSYQKKEESNN